MKKNRTMRVAVLMLALTLITCCFVGSTFAKYTSSATGSDMGTVAKWSFAVETTDIATNDTFAMDLFAIPDDGVKQENGLIAPGTTGQIELNFSNTSDVEAKFAVDFKCEKSAAAATLPIQFKLDDGEWKNDINDLDFANENIAKNGGASAHTLYWQWVFAGDDAVDTNLGIAAAAGQEVNCVVSATVTAEQIDAAPAP